MKIYSEEEINGLLEKDKRILLDTFLSKDEIRNLRITKNDSEKLELLEEFKKKINIK